MDKISHEHARRLIQSAPGARLPLEQGQLAEHLQTCPACRRFAESMDGMEQALRGSLREHLSAAPVPPPAFEGISARMRAQQMKTQVLNFAGIAAAILLVIGLLVTLPGLIPQPGSPRIEPPAPGPNPTAAPDATASPEVDPTEPDSSPADTAFSAQYLFLGAEGDRQALNLGAPDGSARSLLESASRVLGAAWSPDGQWIAYIDACEGTFAGDGEHPCGGEGAGAGIGPAVAGPEIFVMDAGGGRVTRLTTASGLDWSAPLAWSPDGRWLALTAKPAGASVLGEEPLGVDDLSALYLVPLDGSGPRKLSSTEGAQYPRWSPDGRWLGFVREELGLSKLYAYAVHNNYAMPVEPRSFRVSGNVMSGSFSVARGGLYAWLPTPTGTPADAAVAFVVEGPYIDGERIPQAVEAVLVREGIEVPRMSDTVLASDLAPGAVRDLSLSPDGTTFALAQGDSSCAALSFIRGIPVAALQSVPGLCLAGQPGGFSWTSDSRWVLFSTQEGDRQRMVAASSLIASERTAPGASLSLSSYSYPNVWLQARPQGADLGIAPAAHAPKIEAPLPPAAVENAPGQLIYSASEGSGNKLFASRADGTGIRRLLDLPAAQFGPVVSPDGEWVAFMLQQDLVSPAMPFLLHPGDAAPTRIMNQDFPTTTIREEGSPPAGEPQPGDILFPIYTAPAWSPDSKTLSVQVNVDNGMGYLLAMVPADGSLDVRYIDVGSSAEGGPNASWSPDGQRMVISQGEYGLADLYLLDPSQPAGPAALTNLTSSVGWSEGTGAVWSPDGASLAYFAHPPEPTQGAAQGQELRLIRPDGSDTRALAVLEPNAEGGNPFPYLLRWSPDGRYLSYMLNRSGAYGLKRHQMVLIDPVSGAEHILLDLDDQSLQTYTWSPDAQWLAYSTDAGMYVLNVAETLAGQSGPAKINTTAWVWSLQWRK